MGEGGLCRFSPPGFLMFFFGMNVPPPKKKSYGNKKKKAHMECEHSSTGPTFASLPTPGYHSTGSMEIKKPEETAHLLYANQIRMVHKHNLDRRIFWHGPGSYRHLALDRRFLLWKDMGGGSSGGSEATRRGIVELGHGGSSGEMKMLKRPAFVREMEAKGNQPPGASGNPLQWLFEHRASSVVLVWHSCPTSAPG